MKEYDLSLNKERKIDNIKTSIFSAFMAANILFVGSIDLAILSKKLVKYDNPFSDCTMLDNNFIEKYKIFKSYAFINGGKGNFDIEELTDDEKNIYLLYYSILSNESLTEKEKHKFEGFIQYFKDNKYLDYKFLYDKLSTVYTKYDSSLEGTGIGGIYNDKYNYMAFPNENARRKSSSHEILHAEEKDSQFLNYSEYAWFMEGMTSVLNHEYFEAEDGYDAKASFIKILCQFVGPDILFKTRATGDINILINALANKGIEKSNVLKMFDLINKYNFLNPEKRTLMDGCEIIIPLRKLLWDSYNIINNSPENIDPLFYHEFENLYNPWKSFDENEKTYYFNSEKLSKIPSIVEKRVEPFYDNNKKFVKNNEYEITFYFLQDCMKKVVKYNDSEITSEFIYILKEDIEKNLEYDEKFLKGK